MKNWKTTLFGSLAGIATLLQMQGIHVGHVGNGDFLGLFNALLIAAMGYVASDKKQGE